MTPPKSDLLDLLAFNEWATRLFGPRLDAGPGR